MNKSVLSANLLLFITAIIWGFAFVAQRVGMDFVGPFTFNAVRFALGGLSLYPLLLYFNRKKEVERIKIPAWKKKYAGIILGLFLFVGASLQQVGLVYTTAGNAGFITGLYVVIVPLLGLYLGHKTNIFVWLGAFLATIGLYFLSVKGDFTISNGDAIVLISAFFWAIHVQLIGIFSPQMNAIKLSMIQFFVCSALSFIVAFIFENVVFSNILAAVIPILYGGLLSVGVAYTLQIVAQKKALPAHAAIILSLEAVFALIGGWLFLNESFDGRSLFGCGLMLLGMLLAQAENFVKKR